MAIHTYRRTYFMGIVGVRMRAKVIKKPRGREVLYGRVGTVKEKKRINGVLWVTLEFEGGGIAAFVSSKDETNELRMGVKPSGV